MDAALHPVVRLTRTVAAHQLHLQVVQRVDIRKAVAYGALQRRVIGQAVFVAGDSSQGLGRAVPLGFNGRKNLLAQTRIGHQL